VSAIRGIAVHTGRSPPNYGLMAPAGIDSELLASDWRLECWIHNNGDRRRALVLFCKICLLLFMQFPSYLKFLVASLSTDFHLLGMHRTASAQKQTLNTTDISNCTTSTLVNHKQNMTRKPRKPVQKKKSLYHNTLAMHSVHASSSQLLNF